MGPVNDDDDMVTRTAAGQAVHSEPTGDLGDFVVKVRVEAGEANNLADEWLTEEAGYGYGV